MATQPTNLPVPSESPRDLKFNAGKIDEYVTSMGWTYTDRFGKKHYTIEGNNYLAQQAMAAFGYVILTGKTFTTGATLTNPNEVLLNEADGEYYKWTGSFSSGSKVVPENSTTESTGGIGPGAWIGVGDASLRAALAAPEGASLVSLSQGGNVQNAISYVTPEMMGAARTYNAAVDDTPYVQAAIDKAEATGSKVVVLQRQYKLISAPVDFVTPGDDGTVYPGWVGNGDVNLPPEDRPIQKFHLKILNGTRLVGMNKSCGFTGTWNYLTSNIAIEQPGMLLVTRTSGYLGTLTNEICNFTYSNFFVGIIFEGILFQSKIDNVKPVNCGIAMLAHGNENSIISNVDFSGCYSGLTVGGWWTIRPRISGADGTGMYVPPYDGTGGAQVGWCDGLDMHNIGYSVAVRLWGDRHENIDAWFSRYFYKNLNSALTSAGGRASNNTNPSDVATYSVFYGIASRAITILSRNGRNQSNNNITKLRTNGTHRAPVFVNRPDKCLLRDAHVERSGWVDASTMSQIFGIDVQDPRRPTNFLQCTLSEGFIPAGMDYTMPARVSSKPLIPGGWKLWRASSVLDPNANMVGANGYPQKVVWAQDGAPYETILDRVRIQGNNAPDPVNGNDIYVKTIDYYRIPSLVLGVSANRFMHQQGTFTPVVKVGATTVAPTGTPRGFYERIGDTVKCWINFYETGVDMSTLPGQVTIEGFPFPLTSLESTTSYPIVLAAYIKTNASGLSATMSGTTLSLRKNYSSSIFNGSDFLSSSEHFLQLQIEYTVARISA